MLYAYVSSPTVLRAILQLNSLLAFQKPDVGVQNAFLELPAVLLRSWAWITQLFATHSLYPPTSGCVPGKAAQRRNTRLLPAAAVSLSVLWALKKKRKNPCTLRPEEQKRRIPLVKVSPWTSRIKMTLNLLRKDSLGFPHPHGKIALPGAVGREWPRNHRGRRRGSAPAGWGGGRGGRRSGGGLEPARPASPRTQLGQSALGTGTMGKLVVLTLLGVGLALVGERFVALRWVESSGDRSGLPGAVFLASRNGNGPFWGPHSSMPPSKLMWKVSEVLAFPKISSQECPHLFSESHPPKPSALG